MSVIALIDGDIFAYEIAAGSEEPINWGDGLWTLHAWEGPARAALTSRIEQLAEKVGATRILVALSDTENWRKKLLPSYKENRQFQRKPMLLKVLKEHLCESFDTCIQPGLEA